MSEPSQSKYLQYLPAIFQTVQSSDQGKGPFLGRFLRPFEDVLNEFEELLADVGRFFAPALAQEPDFLPWLATWVALVLDEEWNEDKQRRLLSEAMDLYCWRGTVYGMKRYLEIVTGFGPDEIDIRESRWPAGMQIGVSSRIGYVTKAETNNRIEPKNPLFHRHPQAHLPSEQRQPNIKRHNDLVDLIAPPNEKIDAVAHDYYQVHTSMPTDPPPGCEPVVIPSSEPFQIMYRADTIMTIELRQDGVELWYRPPPPNEHPAGTRVGGTCLIEEIPRPYCFIVSIPHDSAKGHQPAEQYIGKVRLILDAEKPAHTQYYLKVAHMAGPPGPHLMQIGIHSSIGLDTTLS